MNDSTPFFRDVRGLSSAPASSGGISAALAARNGKTVVPRGQVVDLTGLVKSLVMSANSGDGVSIRAVDGGHVSLVDGAIRYAAPGKVGFDSFSYTVADQYGDTATGTINIVVRQNDANDLHVGGDQGDGSARYFSTLLRRGSASERDIVIGGETDVSGLGGGGIGFAGVVVPGQAPLGLGGKVWTERVANQPAAPESGLAMLARMNAVMAIHAGAASSDMTGATDLQRGGDLFSLANVMQWQLLSNEGHGGKGQQLAPDAVLPNNGGVTLPVVPPPFFDATRTSTGGTTNTTTSTGGTSNTAASAGDTTNTTTSTGGTTNTASSTGGTSNTTTSTGGTSNTTTSTGGTTNTTTSTGGTSNTTTSTGGTTNTTTSTGGTSNTTTSTGGTSNTATSTGGTTNTTTSTGGTSNTTTSTGGTSNTTTTTTPVVTNPLHSDTAVILGGDRNAVVGPVVALGSNGSVGATLYGAATGYSTIQGDAYDRSIVAYGYSNTIAAGGGNDTITAGLSGANVTVSDTAGDNTVTGGEGTASVTLGDGNNTVTLGGYNNTITLGDGDNAVSAGVGFATITLGNGDNAIKAAGYSNVISVGTGTNVINAGYGYETVNIAGGTDTVTAAGYFDAFAIAGGNVTLKGMTGLASVTLTSSFSTSDSVDFAQLSGGSLANIDGVWTVLNASGGVYATVALPSDETPVLASDGNGGDKLTMVIGTPVIVPPATITETQSGLTVALTSATNTLNLFGYNNVVTASAGNYTIEDDKGYSTITLGDGNNTLRLGGYGEVVTLGNGNSSISGTLGKATISAGNGNVAIAANGYGNNVTLGMGTHTLSGDAGYSTFMLGGESNSLTLTGTNDNITIGLGTESSNTVKGTTGSTTITTGDGNQTIDVGGYYNTIVLGNGDSSVTGSQGYSSVTVGNGDSIITLAGNDNSVTTGSGHSTIAITGGSGGATIDTGVGDDTVTLAGWSNVVIGGLGHDVITGGGGNTYELNGLSTTGGQLDVMDFSAKSGDVLDLSQLTKALAPGWYLSAANDTVDPGALDISITTAAGAATLVATLHGMAGASLASLLAAHTILG